MIRRHSCWTNDPANVRGGPSTIQVQHGWTDDGRRIMKPHTTDWLPIRCGHMTPTTDPDCTGCALRGE